uniref:Uncharacterized protein n=1 Tax=Nomascus leucogenys TaxID=61853 RepID=A0A2I3GMN7_NOMLE
MLVERLLQTRFLNTFTYSRKDFYLPTRFNGYLLFPVYLEFILLLTTLFLVLPPPEFLKGIWRSGLPPYSLAFLCPSECQARRVAKCGCSPPQPHCTSSNKNRKVKGLGLLRRTF